MKSSDLWNKYKNKNVKIKPHNEYSHYSLMKKGVVIGVGYLGGYVLVKSTDGWRGGHDGCRFDIKYGRTSDVVNDSWFFHYTDIETVGDFLINL